MKSKIYYRVKITSLIALLGILFIACKKEGIDPDSDNQNTGKTTAVFNPDKTYGTMTDQEGNVYKTITIGSQTWMAENLRTTKYRDGSPIPYETDNIKWAKASTDMYCNYEIVTIETFPTYGRLYNWYVVSNSRNIAPAGWHVPTYDEWKQLAEYLDGEEVAGGKLKETGEIHWREPNSDANNDSGFTALPGGSRSTDGSFNNYRFGGIWWCTDENIAGAWTWDMNNLSGRLGNAAYSMRMGCSVGCVKD